MIEHTNHLDITQLNDLEHLVAECKKADGSTPNVYSHVLSQPRIFPACGLYYVDIQLIGFISVYFFYENAVEISLIVHPSSRKQLIGKQLIASIIPLIQSKNFHTLIFSNPSCLNSKWLPTYGFTYLHTEYLMERTDLHPLLDYNRQLTFRTATEADMDALCALDEACFAKNQSDLTERFHHLLNSREHQVILASQNNIPVGKAHLRWQDNGASLSDIAILPQYQGKGSGTSLIAHCVNLALAEGKPHLNLDVETHNQRALNLYTRLGFLTQNACDYWSIELDQLISHHHF